MQLGRLLLALCAVCAGCIEPQLQTCGDKLCAEDAVCLANGQCASHESVQACENHVDGEVCQTVTFDGICDMGACIAGRCGDEQISGAEQCDGDAAIEVDCVEFGFDLGIPACNDRCDLDLVNTCTRFGWQRILAEPAATMWSNGSDGIAFTHIQDRAAEVRWAGATFVDDSLPWAGVIGNATTVYAVDDGRVIRSTGGPWEELPSPALGGYVEHASVAPDGTLYIAHDIPCVIKKLPPDGTWTQILNDPGQCNDIEATNAGLLVAFLDGRIERYTAASGAWANELDAGREVVSVLEHDGVLLYGTYGGSVWIREGTMVFELSAATATELVNAGPYAFFSDGDGLFGRLDGGLVELISAPTFGDLYAD